MVIDFETPETPAEAEAILSSLRWGIDQQIINHEGYHVWLGPCFDTDGTTRLGITDCCFVADPCEHHAQIAASRSDH